MPLVYRPLKETILLELFSKKDFYIDSNNNNKNKINKYHFYCLVEIGHFTNELNTNLKS